MIIPKINSESISRVTAGISQILSEKGYQMVLSITDNNPQKELEKLSVPVVVIGQKVKGVSCVYHDDYDAAKELAQILAEKEKTRQVFSTRYYPEKYSARVEASEAEITFWEL